jgi:hypothetical protein
VISRRDLWGIHAQVTLSPPRWKDSQVGKAERPLITSSYLNLIAGAWQRDSPRNMCSAQTLASLRPHLRSCFPFPFPFSLSSSSEHEQHRTILVFYVRYQSTVTFPKGPSRPFSLQAPTHHLHTVTSQRQAALYLPRQSAAYSDILRGNSRLRTASDKPRTLALAGSPLIPPRTNL